MFSVSLSENVELIPAVPPPVVHTSLALPIEPRPSLQEAILLRPTLKQRCGGVVVDWRYVERTDAQTLQSEGRWAFRQNISIIVDFTSGLNLYPDLRLCGNSVREFEASKGRMKSVFAKMATKVNASSATEASAIYSHDAIYSLHRTPENYYTAEQCLKDFAAASLELSTVAAQLSIRLHLRVGEDDKPPADISSAMAFLASVGTAPNLDLAVSTARLVAQNVTPSMVDSTKVGVWLVAGPANDPFNGGVLSVHGPVAEMAPADLNATRGLVEVRRPGSIVVADASLPAELIDGEDLEYAELRAIEGLL